MTKMLLLTIAIFMAVFASSVAGRKAGEGQKEYLPGATLPNAHR